MIRACFLRHPDAPESIQHAAALGERACNDPLHPAHTPPRAAAALVTTKRWASGRLLRIAFRGGRVADRRAVMVAAVEWMKWANVKIAQVTSGPAELRCTFDPSSGSWSMIGTDALLVPPNEPTMNMGWPSDPGRDLHELGHALSLIHEHQDPSAHIPWNRNAVIGYYAGAPNFWPPQQTIENVLDVMDISLITDGGYDRTSIMEYPIPAELVLDPSYATGWNTVLSAEDKSFVGKIYPLI